MKKQTCFLIITGVFAFLFPADAQENNQPTSFSLNGSVLADDRVQVSGSRSLSWQEYKLDVRGAFIAPGKAKFFTDIWLRALGFPDPKHVSDLQNFGKVSPQNLELREVFVDLYGLGLKNLDVTIGRQRIAWGTADRINPTDNINPHDLEDFWDFGRHLGSDGIKAVYYPGKFTVSGVFIPLFKPSMLPIGEGYLNAILPKAQFASQAGFFFENAPDTVAMPDLTLRQSSSAAFRVQRRIYDFDLSLSYAYCRENIPIVDSILYLPVKGRRLDTLAVQMHTMYPRLHVAGFDFAGAIGKTGIWTEAALFVPEKRIDRVEKFTGNAAADQSLTLQQRVLLSYLSNGTTSATPALDARPYLKFVVGLDYAFSFDVYASAQLIHGFFNEHGDSLENYLTANVDWRLFNDRLKISPLGFILEIKNIPAFKDNYAVVSQPQVTWYPIDNTELTIGAHFIDGREGTFFGRIKDNDEVFFKAKYGF
jgi:hypothetical protein